MKVKSVSGGRLATLAAAIGLAVALVALPTVAFAATRASTRISVTKQTVVDWGTPGVTPDTPYVTAKLQKKSHSKWVSLKGTFKIYYYDRVESAWAYLGSQSGSSSLSLPLGARGKYKLVYAGSSSAKTKSTYAYTVRYDTIGDSISNVSASFATLNDTWTGVTVSYDVNWNTEAFPVYTDDDQLNLSFAGTFANDEYYSGLVKFEQQLWEPGTVEFSYRVRTADIADDAEFLTFGSLDSQDDYILMTADPLDESTPLDR